MNKSTHPYYELSHAARQSIDNVKLALADDPDRCTHVIMLLATGDQMLQSAQHCVTMAAWALGLPRDHPKPLDGCVEEQVMFLDALIAMRSPPPAERASIEQSVMNIRAGVAAARSLVSQAQFILREAGDGTH